MLKNQIGLPLLILGLLVLINGCGTHRTPTKPPEVVKVFWGNKDECINFLGSPQAQAERWLLQALDDK